MIYLAGFLALAVCFIAALWPLVIRSIILSVYPDHEID